MNTSASQSIYNLLINGRIINKHRYDGGILVDDEHYSELFSNEFQYESLYEAIGFELIHTGSAYYLGSLTDKKYRETAALRIQGVLLAIARFSPECGTMIEGILDYRAGIPRRAIENIAEMEDVKDMLKACGITEPLTEAVDSQLEKRGVAYWNQGAGLVLTDGGMCIFDSMFKVSPPVVTEKTQNPNSL